PEWWSDLDGDKKVVLVTQGTVANNYDELIRPAIRALKDEDVLVVVTTGGKPPEALEMGTLPANVRVAQFVPYKHLMPKVDALVTNGGFGTIQIALMHGLPVAGFGASEDKMETTMRIQYSGVGIGKKTVSPTESEIRTAVRALLDEPRYHLRAQQMAEEFRQYDTAKLAGDLLESLVENHEPARELTMA
ncbi:glycosyl transferase, partial [bacterium]